MKKGKILLSLMLIAAMTFATAVYLPSDAYADQDYSTIQMRHSEDCPLCKENCYEIWTSTYAAGSTHRFYVDIENPENYTYEWDAAYPVYDEYFSFSPNGNYCDVTFLKDTYYESEEGDGDYGGAMFAVTIYDANGKKVHYSSEDDYIAKSDYVPPIDVEKAWSVTPDLEDAVFTYTGSVISPKITVTDNKGKTLIKGTDYTVKYVDYEHRNDYPRSYCELKEPGKYYIEISPVDVARLGVINSGKYTNEFYLPITVVKPKTQTLTGTASYTKPYSTTCFSLNTKTNGNGKLSYKSNNTSVATVSSTGKVTMKGVGKATITVTAAATSTYAKATKKITVTVKPATNKISSVKNLAGKKMKVTYSKSTKASGYQIQYATNSSFKKAKTVTASGTSKTVSKLTKGKTYYVRVRGYKKVSGKAYYGAWSAKKSVKITK